MPPPRFVRWALITLIVIGALAAAGLVVLQTPWAHDQARRIIETRAAAAINGQLRLGRLEGSFWGGMTFSDVAVTQGDTAVIAAQSITARYSAWRVITTGAIDEITVRGLHLNVIQQADGWNVLGLGVDRPEQAQGAGPSIAINRLEIIDGSARVQPRSGEVRQIADLQLAGSLDYTRRRLHVDLERASARDAGTGLVIHELASDIIIADGETSFAPLHLRTASSRVDGDLRIRSAADDVAIDLRAAPLSLEEIALYVPAVRRVGVSPTVELDASGTLSDMAVRLNLDSEAGALRIDGRVGRDAGQTRINAAVNATRMDIGRWMKDDEIDTMVTADGTVEARIPDDAPERAVVSFGLRSPELAAAGYRATAVKASGQYANGVLDVTGAAAAYGSVIETVARWDGERISARGRAANVNVRRLPRTLDLPALDTDVSGTYDVLVAGRDFRVDAALAESTIDGATIAADTVVHLARERGLYTYDVRGGVANLNLATVRPFVELPEAQARLLEGIVNASIDARGQSFAIDDAVADVRLQLTDSVVAGAGIPALDVTAALNRRRLSARVNGSIAQVSSDALGVSRENAFRADGRIDAEVTLPDIRDLKRLDAASGRAVIGLTNASFRGLPVETLDLDASLAGGLAEVRVLRLVSPDLTVSASGTLAVAENADLPSDLTYEIAAPDLSRLEPLSGQRIEGGATIRGRIAGPVTALTARGDLAVRQLHAAAVRALSVEGKYDVTLPSLDLARATSRFTGTAAFVEVGDTKIDSVVADATYQQGRLALETTLEQQQRSISVTGTMVPHPDHREVHVTALALAAGGPQWRLANGREAVIQYAASRIVVDGLELVSGTSRVAISGAIGAESPAASALTVQLQNVRVEDVNQILLGTHTLTGQIDGSATIEGSMDAPRVAATVTVVNGEVDGVLYERFAAEATYAGDTLEINADLNAGAAGRLTAVGTMPLKFGADAPDSAPSFDLRVQSQTINLGLMQPMLGTDVEALRGTGEVDVRVTGPARAPSILGRVAIVEAGFTLAATGTSYPRVNAVFALDGTRLNVERFEIEDQDRHRATMTGGLSISIAEAPSEFNLAIATDDFHLLDNQFGELSVTSDIRAMGDLTRPLLSGTISVDRARLEVDDLLDRFGSGGYEAVKDPIADAAAAGTPPVVSGKTAVQAEQQTREASAASNASFSITLDMPDSVVLRGRDLRARGGSFGLGDVNVTVGGALSLAKDPMQPLTVRGALNVVRGNYAFQGRRFEIARGSELRFGGDQVLNPLVNVTAERQIGGVLTRVHVTGTARAPEIELSSDPPLDEGDILSLIAFNQTMNELGTGQRVSLAARAGTLAARALATPLADSVGRALDFDVFEIQPTGEGETTGATITVGRQLTESLFVGFRQNFGSDDVSQVSFEYRISEFLRLVTSFAQGADRSRSVPRAETAGLDLFWVIRKDP
jgi:autotransporter translocation and assembly factor TamB